MASLSARSGEGAQVTIAHEWTRPVAAIDDGCGRLADPALQIDGS